MDIGKEDIEVGIRIWVFLVGGERENVKWDLVIKILKFFFSKVFFVKWFISF